MQAYLKAFTGAVISGLTALQVAYQNNHVTTQEWITIALAVVVTFAGVWAVPNKAKAP